MPIAAATGLNLNWQALLAWTILGASAAATVGMAVLLIGVRRIINSAPRLAEDCLAGGETGSIPPGTMPPRTMPPGTMPPRTSLTVVLPAYNEESNIEACLTGLLASAPPCESWRVLLVDDGSRDATASLAADTASRCGAGPERFSLQAAGPRPEGERWVGKNWACSRAMEQVASDWVLFVDADVRFAPTALRRALAQAIADGADLLSLAPRLHCSCLAEWMVQPIMASLLGLGFPIQAANDPADPTAFAAGPFMLFRRQAYEAIGGHRELAGEVVEDLALARRIKNAGLKLRYMLGLDALELRMYRSFGALWEGWSKNWFLGLDRHVGKALGASGVVLLLFSGPWLLTPAAAVGAALITPQRGPLLLALVLGLLGISLQWLLRLWSRRHFRLPLRHWWLMGAGGLVVAALGPTSVWRTLTGRGWTWKGRSLA